MKNHDKRSENKKRKPVSSHRHRLKEGLFLAVVAFATFLLLSLISYHTEDPGWSSTGSGKRILNWGGYAGAWSADILLSLFGFFAYIFPVLVVVSSWLRLQEETPVKKRYEWVLGFIAWSFVITSSCAIAGFYFPKAAHLPAHAGGMLGDVFSSLLSVLFNRIGSTVLLLAMLLSGITLLTGLSWLWIVEAVGRFMSHNLKRSLRSIVVQRAKQERNEPVLVEQISPPQPHIPPPLPPLPIIKKQAAVKATKLIVEKPRTEVVSHVTLSKGDLPPLDLLNQVSVNTKKPFSEVTFESLSQLVEERLSDFGVQVKVVTVLPGPVITRFELELAPGIKVSKITGLAKDIARSLSAVSVRVVEVIPGKSVIGLEIPNENRELVVLRDILASSRYVQSRSPLTLVLGKDISGHSVVVDLTKMPHLLVAGTTGSGKSVSLNAMILSMLYKASPDQLRFIMIDPKMLELSVYDGIPHLLTPVITDMKDAANALRWCVTEMDKRYRLMATLGVRNIVGFNQKVTDAIKQGQPLLMPGALVTDEASAKMQLSALPMVVVIVDELADMMMVVGKKVEDLIARIAQKARAAGIHLIIATQRPSVDVITGLIKANIPTRIAFQVSSRIDSRTILDQQGAEQLLGHGDMLYLPPGAGVPIRVHGAYVADDEVHRVVAAWRSAGEPTYLLDVTDETNDHSGEDQGGGGRDALYDDAVRIVTESRRASISLVQRRLRIGYNRAARIMEEMEAAGVVSSPDHTGAREVLALTVE